MNESSIVENIFEERYEVILEGGVLKEVNENTVFELIRDIKDPEHSFSLEQLLVVSKDYISVKKINYEGIGINMGFPLDFLIIEFRPTIPHCSMAAIIGLSIKFVLEKYIRNYIIEVKIIEGSHVNDKQINKQLCDKDRVLAASENESLMDVIESCIGNIQI